MSDSRNFNCSQDTTTKLAVSNERHYGGVEKKAPIDPMPMGVSQRDIIKSELPCSRHGLTVANPMPIKRTPTDRLSEGQWGRKTLAGLR